MHDYPVQRLIEMFGISTWQVGLVTFACAVLLLLVVTRKPKVTEHGSEN